MGTRREGSFTGNSGSYVRHVKEGSGNGASLTLYRFAGRTWRKGSYIKDFERHVVEG
jgi:hypothetical protein